MSFDDPTRKALAKMVTACRRQLTEDVENQLRQTFALHPDGTILSLSQLTHLTEEQKMAAQALRELLAHFTATAAGKEQERHQSAYNRMVLEISFTILNRLAALRLCEERGLVIECVRKGMASDGFRLFERLAGGGLGTRYETYRVFLESMFDELAVDLGVLFDRTTPQSVIFPSDRALEDVLSQLNGSNLAHIWTEDETIGWIYQYFNPDEERRAMRDASQVPRNSRELAVRNQFFTPRYVVEFLTDNTLGRLWYEMRQGETQITDDCQYFVQHPNEVFLKPGEQPPLLTSEQQQLSKEELLKQPVYIAHRQKKDPRDIKGLDPACGSGHFLLYGYDLFEVIYEEAWEGEDSPPSKATDRTLREDYETWEELRRQLPTLILKHNLYGIDIDSRACQIAALALWLRAQRSYQSLNLKPAERSPIQKINIVCAEPMPGEREFLEEFTAELNQKHPALIGELVERVFEKMTLAGEAGALLKIEEDIREDIAKARQQWSFDFNREPSLFPLEQYSTVNQMNLFDVSGITDEQFWGQAEGWVVEALQDYAKRAISGRAFQRRLFVDDATQGFAFVDICRKPFDFVLMNPPFGDASEPSKKYIEEVYGDTKGDVYKAFVECFQDRLVPGGFLGIISNRTGFFLGQSNDWRERIVLRLYRPLLLADLGSGVLDAMVETAAYVLRNLSEEEDYQLTLGILPELCTIPTDRRRTFSIPKYQKHRGGLKRHQAIQELNRLQNNCYISLVPSHYVRYEVNLDLLKKAQASTPLQYQPLICFRLLGEEDKGSTLLEALPNPYDPRYFLVSPQSFSKVPNSPFCYWISEHILKLFTDLPALESEERIAKQGLVTADDFRFVRAWWEVSITALCPPAAHPIQRDGPYCVLGSYRWFPFAKGGAYCPYYADLDLVVNWQQDGIEIRNFVNSATGKSYSRPQNTDFYFRPGLTWPLRSASNFSIRVLPSSSIFSHKGCAVFVEQGYELPALGILFSQPYQRLIEVSLAAGNENSSGTPSRSYEVGIIQKLPWLEILSKKDIQQLNTWVGSLVRGVRDCHTDDETNHFFIGSILLAKIGIRKAAESWQRMSEQRAYELLELAAKIDILVAENLGIPSEKREEIIGEDAATLCALPERELGPGFDDIYQQSIHQTIRDELQESGGNRQIAVKSFYLSRHLEVLARTLDTNPAHIAKLAAERHLLPYGLEREFAYRFISYSIGCAFGRWDILFATGEKSVPALPAPFTPLPVCSPGMLTDTDGFPILEAFSDYPISIASNGILVDDANHPNDITRRVLQVLEVIWLNGASDVEQEACEILNVRDLRYYFQRPTNFFQDHLKRYSRSTKSRQKAPIYWPLSTISGSYTVWVYYHRLTDQTLYTIVNRYVEPKIGEVEHSIDRIEKDIKAKAGREASELRDKLHEVRTFLRELQEFRQELLRVAQLPYKPNLNDGSMINAAPLYRLFSHRQWAQEIEVCWQELEQGEHEWAHMAYTIWPDRVREVCRHDHSIAIAHGLEELYEEVLSDSQKSKKGKRGSRKKVTEEGME